MIVRDVMLMLSKCDPDAWVSLSLDDGIEDMAGLVQSTDGSGTVRVWLESAWALNDSRENKQEGELVLP